MMLGRVEDRDSGRWQPVTVGTGPTRSNHEGRGGAATRGPRLLLVVAVAVLVGVAAIAARTQQVLLSGGFTGIGGYDDGVYFSGAQLLVHGRLPYRDFLFLQPPGILVALAPFAVLADHIGDGQAFTLARQAFVGLGGVSAVLVVLILKRLGLPAALVGGMFYAAFAPAAFAERSTILEPLGTVGVLLALLLLARDGLAARARGWLRFGWPALAGLALAGAIGVKGWYVVPAAVIVLAHVRRALPILAGLVAGGLAVLGPFLITGGGAMVRQVVLDQLGRPHIPGDGPEKRLMTMLGTIIVPSSSPRRVAFWTLDTQVLVFGLVALVLVALALTVPGAREWVLVLAACSALLLLAPVFFLHYPALTSPPLALVVGAGAHRLLSALPGRPLRVVVAIVTAAAAVVLLNQPGFATGSNQTVPVTALRAAAARVDGCIMSDDPTILIEMNAVTSDLRRGCAFWPDVSGYTYDVDAVPGPLDRVTNERWQRHVSAYLTSGDALILVRTATGLSPATRAALARGPALARIGRFSLYGVPR